MGEHMREAWIRLAKIAERTSTMHEHEREAWIHVAKIAGAVLGITLLIVSLALWASWYRAGLQQRVYERQGVHMTRWEVFMGVKPVERAIRPAQEVP